MSKFTICVGVTSNSVFVIVSFVLGLVVYLLGMCSFIKFFFYYVLSVFMGFVVFFVIVIVFSIKK